MRSRTKGGAGGTTTTVTSLSELEAAVSGTSAGIVIVKGAISGSAQVRVGSNKSIVGAAGSCMPPPFSPLDAFEELY